MRNDVWGRLPRAFRNAELLIIDWAFYGFRRAQVSRPPPPTRLSRADEYHQRHPATFDIEFVAHWSKKILEFMEEVRGDAELMWLLDAGYSLDDVFQHAYFVAKVYQDLRERDLLTRQGLPLPKVGRSNTEQVFFSRFLSQSFMKFCGNWCDGIVAALIQVTFDLPEAISEETVRERRLQGWQPPSGG
jgi:hypothetical protein